MNEKNLIPASARAPNELREICRKGGIASGEARRRKRSMREAADFFLSMPVADKRTFNSLVRKYVPVEDVDNQMAMIVGIWKAACDGDAKAGKLIADLLGEAQPKEEDNQELLNKAAELLGGISSAID